MFKNNNDDLVDVLDIDFLDRIKGQTRIQIHKHEEQSTTPEDEDDFVNENLAYDVNLCNIQHEQDGQDYWCKLAVQVRTIIGFENGGTNIGHLFYFAADQLSRERERELGSFQNSYIPENNFVGLKITQKQARSQKTFSEKTIFFLIFAYVQLLLLFFFCICDFSFAFFFHKTL
ncbi:hypothetical protein LXL04_038461 [Taraxacum kok-saghyz]